MPPKKPPPPPPEPEKPLEPEAPPEPELLDGVYRKELSEEQLKGFYDSAYKSPEEMNIYLAKVLGLRDITYKARNGIIIDYFSGFLLFSCSIKPWARSQICKVFSQVDRKEQIENVDAITRFAKEAGLSVQSTFHVWKLSHDVLDLIKEGASFEEAERHFKKLLLKLSIQQRKTDIPLLSVIDSQKIAPLFTTTVFQHYSLLSYCFQHDHVYWFSSEQVWVETPLTYPLKLSFTQKELDDIQAAKEAAKIAEVVNELLDYLKFLAMDEVIAREEAGNIDLDLLSPDEYVKHKPDTLDEAIERACRHKIEEAKKLFHNDYEGREAKMLTKLVKLEVESGVTPPKPPPPPTGAPTAAAAPPQAPPAGKKK